MTRRKFSFLCKQAKGKTWRSVTQATKSNKEQAGPENSRVETGRCVAGGGQRAKGSGPVFIPVERLMRERGAGEEMGGENQVKGMR